MRQSDATPVRTVTGISARRTLGLVAVVVTAAAVSACGSSGKSRDPSASSGGGSGIAFAECMRSHGVPNFPDPGSGGGIQIPIGSGINPQAPAFQSAQNACRKLLPGGGRPRHASEQQKLRMFAMARCMRAHGVTDFPDPVSGPPAGPPSGGGIAFGAPGAFLVMPQSLVQSPAFKHAAGVCGVPGFGPGGAKLSPAP